MRGVQQNFHKCIYLAQLRPDSHKIYSEVSVAEDNPPSGSATHTVLASRSCNPQQIVVYTKYIYLREEKYDPIVITCSP